MKRITEHEAHAHSLSLKIQEQENLIRYTTEQNAQLSATITNLS